MSYGATAQVAAPAEVSKSMGTSFLSLLMEAMVCRT